MTFGYENANLQASPSADLSAAGHRVRISDELERGIVLATRGREDQNLLAQIAVTRALAPGPSCVRQERALW